MAKKGPISSRLSMPAANANPNLTTIKTVDIKPVQQNQANRAQRGQGRREPNAQNQNEGNKQSEKGASEAEKGKEAGDQEQKVCVEHCLNPMLTGREFTGRESFGGILTVIYTSCWVVCTGEVSAHYSFFFFTICSCMKD